MPSSEELFYDIQGFDWAMQINQNMSYYCMNCDAATRKILQVVTPWGIFECLTLPTGIKQALDIFQHRMMSLYANFEDPPLI